MNQASLRKLPSVHVLAEDPALACAVESFGREAVVAAIRRTLDEARETLRSSGEAPPRDALVESVEATLAKRPALYADVLNATGVILHTNLGRSPLPHAAWRAMAEARGYCDLEMDLGTGKRASRQRGVEEPLVALTNAEAGMMVNNNAAAVLLGLAALAGDRPTAISRGHLVEIGGGFRLPTIMEASGSPLMEVGTTNRTHLKDYQEALAAGAGLLLLVHRSNFIMSGYVSEPQPEEIVELARSHHVPVMFDLGSGAFLETESHGLPRELTVPRAVAMGFDAICFSGDKLLGGPQAGWIVGRRDAVDRLRKHPLARALRCDKLQLAAGVATLELYRRGEAERQVPIWRFISTPPDRLRERAEQWRSALDAGDVVEAAGTVGGGSLPDAALPGFALALDIDHPDVLLAALRRQAQPVVGHIVADRVLLHPRTVPPERDVALVDSVKAALGRY
ncbi:MAG: L-seryl-tRNA(Sec) selenium transferase [Myxococcota bacterium]